MLTSITGFDKNREFNLNTRKWKTSGAKKTHSEKFIVCVLHLIG
jgi:hypothetical protein